MVLEKTLESPLDCKEIQPVHPKGNQSWVFIGRTDKEIGSMEMTLEKSKIIYLCKSQCNKSVSKTTVTSRSPITSWEIDGETVETVSDFIFLGSKITADGDCSHEIKRAYSLEGKL